jgi:hypothetical protein
MTFYWSSSNVSTSARVECWQLTPHLSETTVLPVACNCTDDTLRINLWGKQNIFDTKDHEVSLHNKILNLQKVLVSLSKSVCNCYLFCAHFQYTGSFHFQRKYLRVVKMPGNYSCLSCGRNFTQLVERAVMFVL